MKYENIARRIERNHAGMTVFLLKPTPNSLRLPSALYRKPGFISMMLPYRTINNIIEKDVMFLRTKLRFMIIYRTPLYFVYNDLFGN